MFFLSWAQYIRVLSDSYGYRSSDLFPVPVDGLYKPNASLWSFR